MKLKLTLEQRFCHFSMVWLVALTPIMMIVALLKYYLFNSGSIERDPDELLEMGLIFLIPLTILYFIQSRGLKFKEIRIRTTETEFQEAVMNTKKRLGWTITKNTGTLIKAKKKWDWTISPGELITIYWYDDKILINSICSLDRPGTIMFLGRNKRNISTFEEEIKKASA
jgi:hypothetical protein